MKNSRESGGRTIVSVREDVVRGLGVAGALAYAAIIVWIYTNQPATMAEVTGGLAASVGVYRIDEASFNDALHLFRRDQFEAARAAFARADPAGQDARTQFYIAYSYYRQGWHRTHRNDALYGEGLKMVDKAIALAPGGRLTVDDADLKMRSADELRAELQAGLRRDASDFNPLRLLEERK